MSKREFFTDDYTGAAIEDERDVVTLTIKNADGEITSHLHRETVDNLIEGDADLESVFLHD